MSPGRGAYGGSGGERGDPRVLPSVLDRLIDDDPSQSSDPPQSPEDLLRELRAAIRRDVETFFNTRRHALPVTEDHPRLEGTLLDFGVPDFVGRNLASRRRRQAFLRELEVHLRRHEPRFKSVEIVPLSDADGYRRLLRFRIDAVVYAEPAPEELRFDSRLEPISRAFSVSI